MRANLLCLEETCSTIGKPALLVGNWSTEGKPALLGWKPALLMVNLLHYSTSRKPALPGKNWGNLLHWRETSSAKGKSALLGETSSTSGKPGLLVENLLY